MKPRFDPSLLAGRPKRLAEGFAQPFAVLGVLSDAEDIFRETSPFHGIQIGGKQ